LIFSHDHRTLQTICDDVIIIDPTVNALSYEISMKNAYITIITNKHFGKIEKNTSDQQCMTLDCAGLTQSSVIQTIRRNVGLKHFFSFT